VNVLEFISSLVTALAWPTAVFAILFLLRQAIRKRIEAIKSAKYKDFELSFSEAIQSLEGAVPESLPQPSLGEPKLAFGFGDTDLEALISTSPRGAIIHAWGELESAARATLSVHPSTKISYFATPRGMLNGLVNNRILTPQQGLIFLELWLLRNQAVHLPESGISQGDARFYCQLARNLSDHLRHVASQQA
jgi:hypothetical protein